MSSFASRFVWLCGQLVLILAVVSTSAHAQTGAGSGLSGRVTDPTGASMAGVAVTVVRLDVGFERTTTTNAAGDWEARFLPRAPISSCSSIEGSSRFSATAWS